MAAGKILACKWVKLACRRHLKDLARQKKKSYPYRFDLEKAERICTFIELLPHTKGKWAAKRELLRLSPWQKFVLSSVFGWVRKKDGFRRFWEAYIEVPRKNGKSIKAGGVGLYCFAADNEHGAEVYSGATTEKQAWEIFRPARLMAKRTPDFCDRFGIEVNATTLSIPENGSRFEPLIGSPGDGASPSCVLIDEYHEHDSDELYDTMVTGMGAREQPITFIITTAGSNMAGPCYIKRGQVINVLLGKKGFENEELFGIIYTIDDKDDWTSDQALIKANPNYNVSVDAEYLHSRRRAALQLASKQNAFKTKHLNIWVGARAAWMDMLAWGRAPGRRSLEELAGRPCFIALDLAAKIDVAATLLLFPPTEEDPLYHVHGRYYLPEDVVLERATGNFSHYDTWAKQGFVTLTEGNVIDYDVIMDDLRNFSSMFQVEEIAFDPWQATHLSTKMTADGATMVEVPHQVRHLSDPMKELEAMVKAKRLAHGNCPVLTWMISNVVAKRDGKDNIYPMKEVPENKIDGAVALIMAVSRAIRHGGGGNVYESRGFLTV